MNEIDLIELKVSETEWHYLQKPGLLPPNLQRIVSMAEPLPHSAYLLRIPNHEIEAFRTALTESLAKTGFDEDYEPTADGRMLEDLIDRFFIT